MNIGSPRPNARTAGLKHGLYAKALRAAACPTDQDKKVWDSIERNTSLENELVLARNRLLRFEQLKANGVEGIPGRKDPNTGIAKFHSMDSLIERALAQVESLARSQHHMHPEAAINGAMELKVTIDMGGAAVKDGDVPDLDADGKTQESSAEPVMQPEVKEEGAPAPHNPLEDLAE